MKRLLMALLFVGAAWLGYRRLEGHRAYTAYEGFAESWARETRTSAARYGEPDAVRHAFEEIPLRGSPGGAMIEAFRGTRYTVESQTRSPGGAVELVVRQTIFFDPPGVTSAIGGRMFARFRQAATVHRTGDGWRVAAFESTYLDVQEIRRR